MNKINKIVLLLFIATCSVFAQGERIGTAGATELLIPVGGRGLAMGSASLTNATGVDAIFWNPANVARSANSFNVMASHMTYIADINVEYGAASFNIESLGTIGFSIKSLGMDDILKTTTDYPDGTGQTFNPQYTILGVSYSKMLSDRVSVGLNANYLSETLDLVSASGLSFDFGVTYSSLGGINGFDMAVVLKNIGPDLKFEGSGLFTAASATGDSRGEQFYVIDAASFSLPTILDIGLGYSMQFDDLNQLQLVGSFSNHNYYTDQYKVGAEYNYDDLLFFRGGYNYTTEFETEDVLYKYSLGFGLNYDVGGVGLMVDYAYLPTELFDDTHLVSLSLGIK